LRPRLGENLGVAVTFSVTKDRYSDYQSVFEAVVRTLKVFAQKQKSNGRVKFIENNDDQLGTYIPDGEEFGTSGQQLGSRDRGDSDSENLILIALVAALAGFIIWKKRKGGK
jgi:LPXTG-motif cell wall-anchored protein